MYMGERHSGQPGLLMNFPKMRCSGLKLPDGADWIPKSKRLWRIGPMLDAKLGVNRTSF